MLRDIVHCPDPEQMSEIVQMVLRCTDRNQDGTIDLTEFIRSFAEDTGVGAVVPAYQQRKADDAEVGGVLTQDAVPGMTPMERPMAPAFSDTPATDTHDTYHDAAAGVDPSACGTAAAADAQARALALRKAEEESLSPFPNDVSGVSFTEGMLKSEFERYDRDGSGQISRTEFKRAYKEMEWMGLEPDDAHIDRLFSQFGGTDERMSYQEFCVLMLNRARM